MICAMKRNQLIDKAKKICFSSYERLRARQIYDPHLSTLPIVFEVLLGSVKSDLKCSTYRYISLCSSSMKEQ